MAKSFSKDIYYLHPKYERQDFLGVIINHRRINLIGKEFVQQVPEGPHGPATTITWKGATQEDLKAYYELGNQKIVFKNAVTSSDASD